MTRFSATAGWQVRTHVPILADESLDGYVARVAAAHYMTRTLDLTSLAGATVPHRPELSRCDPERFPLVAACLRADAEELKRHGTVRPGPMPRVTFFGTTIDRRLVDIGTRRYSPAGLEASPHHRALWSLRPFPFCEDSWDLLVRECPNKTCGVIQRWQYPVGIALCDRCGEPLTRSATTKVDPEIRPQLAAAVGLVHPDPNRRTASLDRLPSGLKEMDPGELLDLLCAVAGVIDPSIRFHTARHLIKVTADHVAVVAAVSRAWPVLESWPAAFEDLVTSRLAARVGRFGDGNNGATTDFLRLPARAHLTPAVRDVVQDMRVRFSSNKSRGYSPRKAAALTGATPTGVTNARRAGQLPTLFALIGDRPLPLIDRSAIDDIVLTPAMGYEDAANRLGVTFRAVEELVAAEMLVATPTPLGRPDRARVSRSSLDALISGLEHAAAGSGHGRIPLRLAMCAVGGRLKPWRETFMEMLGGKIPFSIDAGPSALADRITVDRHAVATLLALETAENADSSAMSSHMSKLDAAATLNLHNRQIRPALEQWPSSPGLDRTVPVAAVLEMAERHITPLEINARLLAKRGAATRLLNAAGLKRISVAGYDRSSVEPILERAETDAFQQAGADVGGSASSNG